MDWDAIGAIAELLGVIAVVATLAYLSVQLRPAGWGKWGSPLSSSDEVVRPVPLGSP
jgi:hypothetical protein